MIYLPLPQCGCFVALSSDKKTIFTLPMDLDGELDDSESPTEVSAPDEKFLNYVNLMFKTNFKLSDFPGR